MIPRWLLWTLFAIAVWGVWAILYKLIGNQLSPALSQALSTLGMLPVIAVLACIARPAATGSARLGIALALGAGVCSCLGNLPYYHAMAIGGKAAAVVPLTAMAPLVTVLLAVPLLKERLNALQCAGVALSLAAIYLFNVQHEQGMLSGWLLLALIPILAWGLAGLLQKMATNHISGGSAALWFHLAFLPMGVILYAQEPLTTSLSQQTWIVVLALGFTLAIGNVAILAAFASGGKASIITPLAGMYSLVSIPIAVVLLGERVGWRERIAIALSLTAVLLLSLETRPAPTADTSQDASPGT